jgi:hypothetical protein
MHRDDWAADISLFDERGQLVAVAEVKAQPRLDLEAAAYWFHSYLEEQRNSGPRFVLLITPGLVYLWKRQADETWSEPLTADARQILAPYVQRSKLDVARISGTTFEFLAGSWLEALAYGLWQPTTPDQVGLVVGSGLLEAIENGRVASRSVV